MRGSRLKLFLIAVVLVSGCASISGNSGENTGGSETYVYNLYDVSEKGNSTVEVTVYEDNQSYKTVISNELASYSLLEMMNSEEEIESTLKDESTRNLCRTNHQLYENTKSYEGGETANIFFRDNPEALDALSEYSEQDYRQKLVLPETGETLATCVLEGNEIKVKVNQEKVSELAEE